MKTLFYLLTLSFLLTSCGEQSDEIYPASAEEIAAIQNATLNKCLKERDDFELIRNQSNDSFNYLSPADAYDVNIHSNDEGKTKTDVIKATLTVLNKSANKKTLYIYAQIDLYNTSQTISSSSKKIFKFSQADNTDYFNAYQYFACLSGSQITTNNFFTVSNIIENVSEKSTYSHIFLENFPGLISSFAHYYINKTTGSTTNKWEITISAKKITPSFDIENYLTTSVTDEYCLFQKYNPAITTQENIRADFKEIEETLFRCRTANVSDFNEVRTAL